ncbi:molecular chaperone TorD family protein [Desulfovibrio desulfuricans]|uniref:TorD/DmsD family molecular chaperone n=1 Tax=Desulfovibrio desulfuricans TaxID=876 RepID=UPI0017802031|nr:molecular chaperone TorD family protein [Desulfovibrio desulfuricans]MBD8895912.1 molecular chaperone TorD family protein [Desulfovibrio desulfuricans]
MSPSLPEMQTLAQALRDFFSSTNAEALAAAATRFAPVEILPDSINWQAEEYAFNRLFVGPQAVPAPPYASVYLEAEPRLMGNAAADMREMLQALGLAAPEGQPDDFIACELEVWMMLTLLLRPERGEHLRAHAREALAWLVDEHMARWLPAFVERAGTDAPTPAIQAALRCLEYWLCHCTQRSMYA